jgi:hypothetical protein
MSQWLDAAQHTPEPLGTPPGDLYFEYTKPDGDVFLGSAAHAEGYLRLGYTVSGEQTISDSDAFRDLVSPGTNEAPADGTTSSEATATAGVTAQTPA